MKVVLTQEQYESMLNDFILKELYKKRIDEAIELIKKYQDTCILDEEWSSIDKPLLKILKGEDNE